MEVPSLDPSTSTPTSGASETPVLPTELWDHIFSFLPVLGMYPQLAPVCRAWESLVEAQHGIGEGRCQFSTPRGEGWELDGRKINWLIGDATLWNNSRPESSARALLVVLRQAVRASEQRGAAVQAAISKYSNGLNELLLKAVSSDDLMRVQRLLACGADPSTVAKESTRLIPVLGLAIERGQFKIVDELVKAGANLRATVKWHNGPVRAEISMLHFALDPSHTYLSFVDYLLLNGAAKSLPLLALSFNGSQDRDGVRSTLQDGIPKIREGLHALLHIAAHGDCPDGIQWLVDNGCDVDQENSQGDRPLLIALRLGNEKMARALLVAGADVRLTNEGGTAPLAMAQSKGLTELVGLIQQKLSGGLIPPEAPPPGGPLAAVASCDRGRFLLVFLAAGLVALLAYRMFRRWQTNVT